MPNEKQSVRLSDEAIRELVEGGAHDHADAGDWRGPYGYGHRAYKPNPEARYVFDPGPPRTLPTDPAPEPDVIWKRPLR